MNDKGLNVLNFLVHRGYLGSENSLLLGLLLILRELLVLEEDLLSFELILEDLLSHEPLQVDRARYRQSCMFHYACAYPCFAPALDEDVLFPFWPTFTVVLHVQTRRNLEGKFRCRHKFDAVIFIREPFLKLKLVTHTIQCITRAIRSRWDTHQQSLPESMVEHILLLGLLGDLVKLSVCIE